MQPLVINIMRGAIESLTTAVLFFPPRGGYVFIYFQFFYFFSLNYVSTIKSIQTRGNDTSFESVSIFEVY